jgi:hypothetical protein
MEILNSREIATLFLLSVALIWGLSQPKILAGLKSVFVAAFVGKLTALYFVMLLYMALLVWMLHEIGIWEPEPAQIKATLMWVFTAGLMAVFRAIEMHNQPGYLKQATRDIVSITVVLEFLVGFVTFGVIAELFIVPAVAFLTALHAVAKRDESHRQVAVIIEGLLATLGILILGHAVYEIVTGFAAFATTETVTDLATPLLFSFLFLPFIYLLSIYVAYESIFSRIGFKCEGGNIERYAKWRAALAFNINHRALARWADHLNYNRLDTKASVIQSIADVKNRLAYEKNPRSVPESEGWSPFEAKDYLRDVGLETGNYKNIGDGEWFVSSNALDVGQKVSSNSISYYVSGGEFTAKELKLKLCVLRPDQDCGLAEFTQIAESLLSKALGGEASTNLEELVTGRTDAQTISGETRISLTNRQWEQGDIEQFDVMLTLTRDS